MRVRLVISGRAYDVAAGLPDVLELAEGSRLSDALRVVAELFGQDRRSLSAHCLVSVRGEHVGTLQSHQDQSLQDGDELLLVAPVAGG